MSVIPSTLIPRKNLPFLFLTNTVPTTALQADPRISYAAYIPDEHYLPTPASPKLPLLVTIHGTHRDHLRYLNIWKPFADRQRCAILAPLFPTMLQGPLDVTGYHHLGQGDGMNEPRKAFAESLMTGKVDIDLLSGTRPSSLEEKIRHDLCLLAMLDEVAIRWPGVDTSRVMLAGFSGGAQFVHRFFYLHPERLSAVAVASPGSVTMLDDGKVWPDGIQDIAKLFAKEVNHEALREMPVTVAVGEQDGMSKGIEMRQKSIGGSGETMLTRVQLARALVQNWSENGLQVGDVVVQGAGHEMEKIHPTVEEFMVRQIKLWWQR